MDYQSTEILDQIDCNDFKNPYNLVLQLVEKFGNNSITRSLESDIDIVNPPVKKMKLNEGDEANTSNFILMSAFCHRAANSKDQGDDFKNTTLDIIRECVARNSFSYIPKYTSSSGMNEIELTLLQTLSNFTGKKINCYDITQKTFTQFGPSENSELFSLLRKDGYFLPVEATKKPQPMPKPAASLYAGRLRKNPKKLQYLERSG